MNQPAIELKRLTRYFGSKPVVRDLDFDVPVGKVTALLGLNGAGKTTTIRMLMGLLSPTRGRAITLGQDAAEMTPQTRSRIGYLVEGHYLYGSMRVSDCQQFQRAGNEQWDSRLFDDVVRHFAIDPKSRVSNLSRGQRAGVALALVLAPGPELLVLDDPALGLDPVSRRALNETLVQYAGDGERTVLLSTHLLDDVERIADRVAVMIGGRLKVDTTMEDFGSRITTYAARSERLDADQLAAVPGLVEARRLADRWQLTLADEDDESRAALKRLNFVDLEQTESSFADAVLSYLTRERSDGSFFTQSLVSMKTQDGNVASGVTR
ncbi:ABC transporter ATP-binding protein [Stieleria varia]|uniref:Putative ABC transporter ATP-binding protein YbhF n=1 Tax=Stieleria varia TaxID=2528005 RepID=A0A5C6A3T3_9BACT|nr:ABC transporter ATP-binding protein [Stieleria varia]TWT93861.1 putative ABC transporter ATP-binding protein YbhF [Stieleria varia]